MKQNVVNIRAFTVTVVMLCLCVAPGAGAQEGLSLETRVLQYWTKRQAKDLAAAWTFYCAEYQARVAQPQFMQMTRLLRFDLRDLRVAQVAMKGDKADVAISYTFSIPTMPDREVEGRAEDTWSKGADGQWCKDDEPLVLPFPTSPVPASAPGAAAPGAPPPGP